MVLQNDNSLCHVKNEGRFDKTRYLQHTRSQGPRRQTTIAAMYYLLYFSLPFSIGGLARIYRLVTVGR